MGVRKQGRSHDELIAAVATSLGIQQRDIGYAGRKDRFAVTTQQISVHRPGTEELPPLNRDDIEVLWTRRHGNKLKLGHLLGNRFHIRVRGLHTSDTECLQDRLGQLERSGLANAFGPQRFGVAGHSHLLGEALLKEDWDKLVQLLLGGGGDSARDAFDAGDLAAARSLWPARFVPERSVLSSLMNGANPQRACDAVRRPMRRFWISALQSAAFNTLLGLRQQDGSWNRLLKGDVAWMLPGGRTFLATAEDTASDDVAQRLLAGTLSASGPMWGAKMRQCSGRPRHMEEDSLAATGLDASLFTHAGKLAPGTRRPLKVPVQDTATHCGTDDHGDFMQLTFSLPAGSYATVALAALFEGEPVIASP
jgi:tRNA pseudouridine13 synthase